MPPPSTASASAAAHEHHGRQQPGSHPYLQRRKFDRAAMKTHPPVHPGEVLREEFRCRGRSVTRWFGDGARSGVFGQRSRLRDESGSRLPQSKAAFAAAAAWTCEANVNRASVVHTCDARFTLSSGLWRLRLEPSGHEAEGWKKPGHSKAHSPHPENRRIP